MRPVITDLYPSFRCGKAERQEVDADCERQRQIAFGEAILAMSVHCGVDPGILPDRLTDELLERAYAVMNQARPGFSTEDFTLYFLSKLHDAVPAEKRQGFRRGAARYLRDKRPQLARDIARLESEVREQCDPGTLAPQQPRATNVRACPAPENDLARRLARAVAADEFILKVFDRKPVAEVLAHT